MRIAIYALSAVMVLGVSACGSSSSSSSGMSEQDSVVAAAHVAGQDMSQTLDTASMDDSDTSESTANSRFSTHSTYGDETYRRLASTDCVSGSHDEGSETGVDVGSPHVGEMDIDWEHFQNCEQDMPTLSHGYTATATAEHDTDDIEYGYRKITGDLSHPYAASDFDGDGFIVEGSFFGDWNLAMLRYQRITASEFDPDLPVSWEEEAYIDWLMEIPLDDDGNDMATVHMIMGSGPDDGQRMQMMTDVSTDPVTREIDGYAAMTVTGDGQDCAFAVTYETVQTLEIDFQGMDFEEYVVNGELAVDVEGGGDYTVTWSEGDMFVDGQQVDPDNLPEQCEFVMEMD